MRATEIASVIAAGEWSEMLSTWQYEALQVLAADVIETRVVVNALVGAMPPALQRRWPHTITRARRLTTASTVTAAPVDGKNGT